jgi:hypothetical protein
MGDVGLYSSAAGAGIKAYGAYLNARGEKLSYEYNAKLYDLAARNEEIRAAERQEAGFDQLFKLRVAQHQTEGSLKARIAARGGALEGSHLAQLRSVKWVSDLDAKTLQSNTDRAVYAIRANARAQAAKGAGERLKASQVSPELTGFTSLISDAAGLSKQWYRLNPQVPGREPELTRHQQGED